MKKAKSLKSFLAIVNALLMILLLPINNAVVSAATQAKVTISSVANISTKINLGSKFVLPSTVTAVMSDKTKKQVSVSWGTQKVDTDIPGSFTFQGTVQGYSKKVELALSVVDTAELGSTIGNNTNGGKIVQKGDWLYYSDERTWPVGQSENEFNFSRELYKVKVDGTNKTKLATTEAEAQYINVIGDWIYFLDRSEMFKMKTDGTGKTSIAQGVSYIYAAGSWIYYIKSDGGDKLYKLSTDGTKNIKITSDDVYNPIVAGNWIFYINNTDNGNVYKIKVDGTGRTKLTKAGALTLNYLNGWIYFSNMGDHFKIYKMKADGSSMTKVGSYRSQLIVVQDSWIYFVHEAYAGEDGATEDSCKLYRMKTDGTGLTKIADWNVAGIQVIGEWVYYEDYNNYGQSYKIRVNGKDKQRVDETGGVTSVDNISASVKQGAKYVMPASVKATLSTGGKLMVPVVWDRKDFDTSKSGSFESYGTVEGYEAKVKLTLTIAK